MQITITFDPQDPAQVAHAICMLNGTYTNKPQPQVGDNSGSTASGLILSPEGSAGDATGAQAVGAAAPVATRRGRKPKDVAPTTQEVAAAQPGESNGATSTSAPSTDTSTAATTTLTLDDVRAKLQTYTVAKGVPAGIELLKKFGAQRISELAAEKYADFVKECV